MMAFLASSLGKYAILAVVLAGLAAGIYVMRLQRDEARATAAGAQAALASALAVNAENLRQLEALKEATARAEAAVAAAHTQADARLRATARAHSEIDHAPASDDGPVAPVLARVLERMRGAAAARPDTDTGGAGQPAR